MIAFLGEISSLIVGLLSLLVHLIQSVIMLFVYVFQGLTTFITSILWLPNFLQGYAMAFLAIAIVKFILSHGEKT